MTDTVNPGDSMEDRWQCLSIRVAKDRDFKPANFKCLKKESVEVTDDSPESDGFAKDTIAELEGEGDELTAVHTLLENGGEP